MSGSQEDKQASPSQDGKSQEQGQRQSESAQDPEQPRHRIKIIAEPGDDDERDEPSSPTYGGNYASTSRQPQPPKPDPKVDPLLRRQEVVRGSHPGDRYVRYGRNVGAFRRQGGVLEAQIITEMPRGRWGRGFYRVKRVLIGRPISTEQSIHERLTNVK